MLIKNQAELVEALKPFVDHKIVKEVSGALYEIAQMQPNDKHYKDILFKIIRYLVEITVDKEYQNIKSNEVMLVDIAHAVLNYIRKIKLETDDELPDLDSVQNLFRRWNPPYDRGHGEMVRWTEYTFTDSICLRELSLIWVQGENVQLALMAGQYRGKITPAIVTAERIHQMTNALMEMGFDKNYKGVKQFPSTEEENYIFQIEGPPEEIQVHLLKILNMIKRIEGEKVFGSLESEISNLIPSTIEWKKEPRFIPKERPPVDRTARFFSNHLKRSATCFKTNLTYDLPNTNGKWAVEESSGMIYRTARYIFAHSSCIASLVLKEFKGSTLPTLTLIAGKFEGNQIKLSGEASLKLEHYLRCWTHERDGNILQYPRHGREHFFEIEAGSEMLQKVIIKMLRMIKQAEGMDVFSRDLEKEIYNFIPSEHPEIKVDSFDTHERNSLNRYHAKNSNSSGKFC